ncbi:hypothetical protein [Marinivivus vitaminiproducens]|uniref:hypothetical protein n=1 Tax=Marinivivus vitaminiproducens TaxID=3035935 RepID=UPI00279FF223|nr:hypothetical protein P4R82_08175 [Geminicoccaceae bacterium SCSIO 64248]
MPPDQHLGERVAKTEESLRYLDKGIDRIEAAIADFRKEAKESQKAIADDVGTIKERVASIPRRWEFYTFFVTVMLSILALTYQISRAISASAP